ncbi:hypothetical protein P171DRAFT_445823 [Karstenula rhodostoma CBS 690.94]|uniref:DUF6594 domain-containing protein n=1 Tax=Karstenula rhodostoma CBS 690.94 TaxID=1392251 RepID=A0A9P4UAG4_9PLEO|nr:hypothetical protein P171DRAFT_445823 [Karstenula rhodostoma CBS 690.94]
MQAQQTPRPTHSYGQFYIDSADFAEQLKFRRFGPRWFKKLYDDEEEILVMERDLNNGIAELLRQDGRGPLTTLDYPRILAKRDGKLYGKWMKYENKLRAHAQDLCLVNSLHKLPIHGSYAGARLNDYPELFKNDTFGPTNERGGAAAYQDPAAPDFVAVVGVESHDFLTDLAVNHIVWIDQKILERLRRWSRMSAGSNHIKLSTLITFFDTIACIFVPVLLTATMFTLARVPRLMVRIAVVGVFGLVFSASAKLLSGRMSRFSIFSLTAAYFAVASVFVSTAEGSTCKTARQYIPSTRTCSLDRFGAPVSRQAPRQTIGSTNRAPLAIAAEEYRLSWDIAFHADLDPY